MPTTGIYPSGGSLDEQQETVEMGQIGMAELDSLVECGGMAMSSR